VHSCIGTDGRLSPGRIARAIAQQQPHVVALQEVDVSRARTDRLDQARVIARALEMSYYFHPSLQVQEEEYGNVILTVLPMRLIRAGALPGLAGDPAREPRGALWVAVEFEGVEVQVLNTHLGLSNRERLAQAACLTGSDWLAHPHHRSPFVLCGDFNAIPASRVIRTIRHRLGDVQHLLAGHRPRATFPSRWPVLRIDNIFIDHGLQVMAIEVPRSAANRKASDHLPLVADLRLLKPTV
jgi:endonuclease/exonuclease/phosphatase family metal-dependent hydrolase